MDWEKVAKWLMRWPRCHFAEIEPRAARVSAIFGIGLAIHGNAMSISARVSRLKKGEPPARPSQWAAKKNPAGRPRGLAIADLSRDFSL
jgi:hypothetical protein